MNASDPPTSSIRAALRLAIERHHIQASNSSWLARLREPDLQPQEYDRVLLCFQGLHGVLLARASEECPPWTPYYRKALRIEALTRDLAALQLRPLAEIRTLAADTFANAWEGQAPEAWAGRTYVLVGSLLGAQVIGAAVKRSLHLDSRNGASFFSGLGEEKERDRTIGDFFAALESTPWTDRQADLLCASAAHFMETYVRFWIEVESLDLRLPGTALAAVEQCA